MVQKLTILFEGWYDIPHSYAIILAFKIIHLYKKYENSITFYKKKCDYYNPKWIICKVLPIEYQKILDSIPEYNPLLHSVPDIIYSVLFPYDVSVSTIPKCVFYTSEFKVLGPHYFKGACDRSFTDLYFTGPSKWSVFGLKDTVAESHNKLISHGVDPNIFYKSIEDRNKFRSKYSIKDDEIVFLNMGSMTSNKNVSSVILAFLQILLDCISLGQEPKYRLVLKGSDQLYGSSLIVKEILSQITNSIDIFPLIEKYIIFIYDMLTYDEIRSVYNGSDCYVGPYLAEGFSLTHLEALFTSLPIIVPSTGATEDYINDLMQNDPSTARLIHVIPSTVKNENNQYYNSIDINDIMTAMKKCTVNNAHDAEHDRTYLVNKYSWSTIVDQLYDYFIKIKNKV